MLSEKNEETSTSLSLDSSRWDRDEFPLPADKQLTKVKNGRNSEKNKGNCSLLFFFIFF